MKQPDPHKFLWDVAHACDLVQQFTAGKALEAYRTDELLRSAVERQFMTVGEALAQLARTAPSMANQVPELRRIVAFRNVLVHGYSVIDDEEVWQVVNVDIPALRRCIQTLLEG